MGESTTTAASATTTPRVRIGFEIGSASLVEVQEHHMMVTGMTDLAGKTTAIESIIHNWPGTAKIVFVTKRGEKLFKKDVKPLKPFLKQRSDWRYIESLIEGSLQEKNRILRTNIMRVTEGTKNLDDVFSNVKAMQEKKKLSAFDQSMLYQLQKILEPLIPELKKRDFAQKMDDIYQGTVYVMDLSDLPEELQAMVIGSVCEDVEKNHMNTLVVIPEVWKFLPNGRGTPAKLQVESLIRQGATNRNWVVCDSQDLAGVHPPIRKQTGIFMLGRQSDKLEAKRTLDNIPVPASQKPKLHEIQTLERGHFYLIADNQVRKVYVRPIWMSKNAAVAVAAGKTDKEAQQLAETQEQLHALEEEEEAQSQQQPKLYVCANCMMDFETIAEFQHHMRLVHPPRKLRTHKEIAAAIDQAQVVDIEEEEEDAKLARISEKEHEKEDEVEEMAQKIVSQTPHTDKVLVEDTVAEVVVTERVVPAEFADDSVEGMVVILIKEGFFDNGPATVIDIHKEITAKFQLAKSARYGASHAKVYRDEQLTPALYMLARKPYEVLKESGDGKTYSKGLRPVYVRARIVTRL